MSISRAKLREYFDRYTYNVGLHGTKHLDDVYRTHSYKKSEVWKEIQEECTVFEGHTDKV